MTIPEPPDLARLAETVETRARRQRTVRRGAVAGALAAVAVAAVVLPLSLGGADRPQPADAGRTGAATTPPTVSAPDACVPDVDDPRDELDGTAVWARFCPGPDGLTRPAEVPSDALTSHLDFVATITDGAPSGCVSRSGRTYRLQIGFADGRVAEIEGRTDPECAGQLAGTAVTGPPGLGVYGAAMAAFGRQYADQFEEAVPATSLTCPADPWKPGRVDVDGASATLDTGYLFGLRAPMVMPVTAVRGILCTWAHDGFVPAVSELAPQDAERVRIGMHAIDGAMVDCLGSREPTYTAVVEDETGTRRAVTVIDSQCSTVVRSKGGYGSGFAWLER